MEGAIPNTLASIRHLITTAESSKHSKPNSLKLLVCLKYVKALLEDTDPALVSEEALTSLETALEEAKVLMETSGSKVYKVWRCQLFTSRFENVTMQMEHAIHTMFLSTSDTLQSRIENCLMQLQRTNFFVDISDERLAEELNILLSERNDSAVSVLRLEKLASKLDIRCQDSLAKELEALELVERNTNSPREKEKIHELHSLFSLLQGNASETEPDKAKIWSLSIPADFRCPLSLELMVDPVIVASGQTYERAYIQRWLDQGNRTCPKTRQPLSHDNLIPNYTVKALITSWCEVNNISVPESDTFDWIGEACSSGDATSSSEKVDRWAQLHRQTKSLGRCFTTGRSHHLRELDTIRRFSFQENTIQGIRKISHEHVEELVSELNSASADRRAFAVSELRLLAKNDMENRILIAEAGAIRPLVTLLDDPDQLIQENAVTALLNLSINDNNKSEITLAGAIDPLIRVLAAGTPVAMENSAATLFSLSVVDNNKAVIGAAGAIPPLVDLLATGSPRGKKDAATALFNLSISHDNKSRIVRAGAVKPLVELITEPSMGMVDKAVAVLANLSTIPEGRVAIGDEGGISALVEVVEAGSPRGKENAAAALLHLCLNSNKHRALVLQEGAIPPLHALSQTGTARAKEKALALLRHFREQRSK